MENGGLVFGKMIAMAIKNNRFLSFIVIGDRNIGKSTYTIKALYEAFMILADDPYAEDECWKKALDCIKFKISDVTDYLKEGTSQYKKDKTKKPCLVWDDMRKYASGTQYFIDKELYNEISGLLDTIKIPINVFIGTCPSMKGVMGILQDYDSYQINVEWSPRGGNYRLAKGFLWKTSPKGQRAIYSKFRDTFYYRLPNKIWNDYETQRIEISEESITAIEKVRQKRNLRNMEDKIRSLRLKQKIKKLEEQNKEEP